MNEPKLWNTISRKDEIIFIDDNWYILIVKWNNETKRKPYIGKIPDTVKHSSPENWDYLYYEGNWPGQFVEKIPKKVLQAYYFYDYILHI